MIRKVAADHKFREALIIKGKSRVTLFPEPEEKYRLMLQWIQEVVERTYDGNCHDRVS
jgi:hypothetical protein